jgi:hypothetical protein
MATTSNQTNPSVQAFLASQEEEQKANADKLNTASDEAGRYDWQNHGANSNPYNTQKLFAAVNQNNQNIDALNRDPNGDLASTRLLVNGNNADQIAGAKAGEAILGPNGLGRIADNSDVQDVLARSKNYANQGYGADVLQASRDTMDKNIDRATGTASNQLAGQLARYGVKGAVAGNQELGLQTSAMLQKAQGERDLFTKNADFQYKAAQDYGKGVGEVASFDLGQVAKEKNIVFQSMLGNQEIASSERSAANAAYQAAQAQAASSSGGKIICTELYNQGLMSKDLYLKDQAYGELLFICKPEIIEGYHILAKPVVKIMKSSKFFTKYLIKPIAMPWALHISGQTNHFGAIINTYGQIICKITSHIFRIFNNGRCKI